MLVHEKKTLTATSSSGKESLLLARAANLADRFRDFGLNRHARISLNPLQGGQSSLGVGSYLPEGDGAMEDDIHIFIAQSLDEHGHAIFALACRSR